MATEIKITFLQDHQIGPEQILWEERERKSGWNNNKLQSMKVISNAAPRQNADWPTTTEQKTRY